MQDTSYPMHNVSVRFAAYEDLWPIYAVNDIAVKQKDNGLTPDNLDQARFDYDQIGKNNLNRDWKEKSACFVIANVPAANVSMHIHDHQGKTIGGFYQTTVERYGKKKTLSLDKLFAIRTDFPIGSILLDHCIEKAQSEDMDSVSLNAPFAKSRKWYKECALFEELEIDEDPIFTYSSPTYLLKLCRDNFSDARTHLQNHIAQIIAARQP